MRLYEDYNEAHLGRNKDVLPDLTVHPTAIFSPGVSCRGSSTVSTSYPAMPYL